MTCQGAILGFEGIRIGTRGGSGWAWAAWETTAALGSLVHLIDLYYKQAFLQEKAYRSLYVKSV